MRTALKIAGWILIPELMLIDAVLTCYGEWREMLGYTAASDETD